MFYWSEAQKKLVLFSEINQVKYFLSLTCPHSRMGIRIHIFKFKKQQNKKQESKEAKEIKEKKRRFAQNRLKK